MTQDEGFFDDLFDDDFDEEEFLAQWAAADAEAARVLAETLADHRGLPPPEEIEAAASTIGTDDDAYLAAAVRALWERPEDPAERVVAVAGSLLRMEEDPGLEAEEQASVMSLEYVDLLGMSIEAVQRGPGTSLDPDHIPRLIEACSEVEGAFEPDDEIAVTVGFWPLVNVWRRIGVIDRDFRLTRVGAWVLPRAISWTWGVDFDQPAGDG